MDGAHIGHAICHCQVGNWFITAAPAGTSVLVASRGWSAPNCCWLARAVSSQHPCKIHTSPMNAGQQSRLVRVRLCWLSDPGGLADAVLHPVDDSTCDQGLTYQGYYLAYSGFLKTCTSGLNFRLYNWLFFIGKWQSHLQKDIVNNLRICCPTLAKKRNNY